MIAGIVVEGDHRGRALGFPTANLVLGDDVSLDDGVYAGYVTREDRSVYLSAISVGRRPTFYLEASAPRLLEAFLLDFDGDLYGERLQVEIGEMIRPQQHFDGLEALISQISSDVGRVREVLGSPGPLRD